MKMRLYTKTAGHRPWLNKILLKAACPFIIYLYKLRVKNMERYRNGRE